MSITEHSRNSRAGIVTVVGKPNAGKSTVLNRIVGQKLSITSDKPQSTRDRIVGIRSTDTTQMVILDTPGLLDPAYALQAAMRHTAVAALQDADVVVYLVDAKTLVSSDAMVSLEEAAGLAAPVKAPVVTVINKIDVLNAEQRVSLEQRFPDALFISALTGEDVDVFLLNIEGKLPESPFLYPAEDISTQSVRFFAAELIRETALELLEQEVPYSLACEIEEFRESRDPVYVRAVLYVERESQKRILIGEQGKRIKAIGSKARKKIETLIDQRIYLDLWVKVLQNWRKDAVALRRFGYSLPKS